MADVALRLGTSERHVRRLLAERRIPIVKVGRFVRFEDHEIEHWIDDHRVAPSGSVFPGRRGR
jgi:excisionase family DNA binding protein